MSRDITPISFKTVPGRNKTQKWTKAPAVDYGGDEWGGYDDYDDYEADRHPLPPQQSIPAASQAPRDPYAAAGPARKNSFDQGDETRAFSSTTAQPTDTFHSEDVQPHNTLGRSPTRDFTNPEQVPAPLSMHNSPIPTQSDRWPGRKESMSSRDTPPVASAASTTAEKPLPFIRPSDIYKRIPDEIRRQSEDGARPSMDSIGSGARERVGLGLEPVVENRESRVFLDGADNHSTALRTKSTSPRLPDVTRFSGFGDEFLTGSAMGSETLSSSMHSPEAVMARVANAPFTTTSSTTSPSSFQHTSTTRAPPGQDPAAEILAERRHDTSVESIAGGQPASLQHQPSAGFRSAVHTAFDRNDNSISRDNSQGSADVHRSDTTSTAGISPIIGHSVQFPSIAEETASTTGNGLRGQSPESRVTRKPSPRRTGGADFEPGYRRSLDPPSTGTSPARTPGLESVETRRLSTPMSAVPMDAESPDVMDQGAEISTATLQPVGQLSRLDTAAPSTAPIPITGRGRSNTDYSMREADIAQTVNSASPEQEHEVSGLINAQRDSQKLFLQTHIDKQPPSPISPGGGFREGASGSRAGSPAKGRVREIADKYHGMNEAARRNSAVSVSSSAKALSTKSSWSNFDDTEKKLARHGTGESEMFPAYENADLSPVRPGVSREESFKPDLPGGWISTAPTPVPDDERNDRRALTPQQTSAALADEDELTPTTRKVRLQEAFTHKPSEGDDSKAPSALDQVKNAGSELGAALMASVGVSHQTRDFGSKETAAPVDEREVEKPARGMQPPTLFRHETDSDAPSVASTMPPSPPAKDSPTIGETLGNGYFSTVAPLKVKSREDSPVPESGPTQDRGLSLPRPGMTTALSMDPGADDQESDRLRKEIVRSLDPIPPIEDAQLIQDALDAPENQRRVAAGQSALPPAESRQPALLQTRFSWEKPTPMSEQAEQSPEIKPEMSYERPRSKALHVVNPNENDSPITETPVAKAPPVETLRPDTFGTPVIEKHEPTLLPDTNVQPGSPSQSLKEIPPSPSSERKSSRDVKRQSYYASDSSLLAPINTTSVVPGQGGLSTSPISSAKASGPAKPIPPFRNILALKTGDERIKSYNETRTTFANMNTGLGDWLGGMLAAHPELASDATTSSGAWKAPPLQTTGTGIAGTFLKGHKASPSLAKFTNKFGGSEAQLRSTSVGSVGDDSTHPSASSPSVGGGGVHIIRPTTSNTTGASSSTTGLPAFDTDKMQQKGKAFMAKTGVLGGKAQAGAKGLFAKGKSRFASGGSVRNPSGGGNEKVLSPSAPMSHPHGGGFEEKDVSSAGGMSVSSPMVAAPVFFPSGLQDIDGLEPSYSASPLSLAVDGVAVQQEPVSSLGADVDANVVASPVADVALPSTSASSGLGPGLLSTKPVAASEGAKGLSLPPPTGNVADAEQVEGGSLPGSGDVVDANGANITRGDINLEAVGGKATDIATSPPQPADEALNATMSSKGGVEGGEASDANAKQNGTHLHDIAAGEITVSIKADEAAAMQEDNSLARISTTPEFVAAPTMEGFPPPRPFTAHPIIGSPDLSTPLHETSTSTIFGIRPGFSRHTTEKSTSPFRSNSPFRRDTSSQSPGSADRKSRPLSMVWGDWLRDKTRSVSRSGSRKERRSRPASMVLDKTDTTPMSTPLVREPHEEFTLGDLSDVAVYSSSTTAPIPMPSRTETWNSPDAVLPPTTPETRELVLERLGVLPSPAPTATTFVESPGSRRRRTSSAAGRMGSVGGEGLGLDLETVPSQECAVGGSSVHDTASKGRASPVRLPPAMIGLGKVSEVEEDSGIGSVGGRPGKKRRVSDLEMLPSELKRAGLEGQGMPRPDSMILLQSQVDLLAGTGQDAEHEALGTNSVGGDGDDARRGDRIRGNPLEGDSVLGATEAKAPQFEVQKSRPTTGYSSGRVTADAYDDARSEVSAEEGAVDEALGNSTNPGTSRHSSVSSLGAPDPSSASQGAVDTSTQSAPAGSAPTATLPVVAAVANTPSASQQKPQRPGMTDRALSYMPLPRDEDGVPVPETITTGSTQQVDATPSVKQSDATVPLQQNVTTASLHPTNTLGPTDLSPVAVDLGAMSGPPPGTPPFQKHPVFRNSAIQAEPWIGTAAAMGGDAMGTQSTATPTGIIELNRQGAPEPTGPMDAKRRSGFFGKPQTGEAPPFAGAPPPNRIMDNHGLEDLQASDDEGVPSVQPNPRERQPVEKQPRRRSGIWDVLTTKRASSGTKLDIGGDSAASPGSSSKACEEFAKRKLQKPQRASSSAVDLQPKKKRFSALGSIFRRSGTKSEAAPKTNKLTKMAPPSSENVRRTESPRQDRPGNDSTVSGNVRSYEEYEARRKRETAAFQGPMGNVRPAGFQGTQERSAPAIDTIFAQPHSQGWYDQSDGQRLAQQPTLPAVDPQPEYRTLHSQGRTNARPTFQVPQAFRPVEASFNAPVTAVGPPPDPRMISDPRAAAVPSSSHRRSFSFNRQNSYGSAYASEFSGFSGQQVAGQMQQSAPSQSSYGPDVSPIVTRAGPPSTQGQRVISRGTETARSPAHDYPDQQTPWAITIPPGQASTRTSRRSSWDMQPEGTQYAGPPPGAPYHQHQQQQYPPQSGYNGPYFPPSQEQGRLPPSYHYEGGDGGGGGAYTSQQYPHEPYQQQHYNHVPRVHQQYSYPQHPQQQIYQSQHQPPRPQNRYYSQQHNSAQQNPPPSQQQYAYPQTHQPYDSRMQQQRHHHRRRSSGYSGRRDDMTAGEEELIMRGVSYPGQEWQPPGLGRSGWD